MFNMFEWSFDTRDARAARETRVEFARQINRMYGSRADAGAAELLLGELIGNVVRYAPGVARVQASFDERGVTIAVHDYGSGFAGPPNRRETHALAESGRGLAIVSSLADRLEIICPANAGCSVRARFEVVQSQTGVAAGR